MDKEAILMALTQGEEATLDDVLINREQRQYRERQWLQHAPTQTLVVLKLNTPGPIKANALLSQISAQNEATFMKRLLDQGVVVQKHQRFDQKTGVENFWLLDTPDALEIKRLTTAIESASFYGRLADFDVYRYRNGQVEAIKRTQLNLPVRQCYVCKQPAAVCGRTRRHSVAVLLQTLAEKLCEESHHSSTIEG
ncbi:MAG: citrate lyase holo-[acyl-carrier protein] synthase [Aerococcus sp.]|nr:citrate lyase holo-[acyl-carrier protein] synthase [Aerococcus sp.]